MDELKKQVGRAHSRLTLQRFLSLLAWTLFVALVVAMVAQLVPKFRHLAIDSQAWLYGWLGGTAAVAVVTAIFWVWLTRTSRLDAAIELDQRFGLKERVSSTLALSEEELQTSSGQALVDDATRRLAQVEISDRFRTKPKWWSLLPLVPALAIFLIAVFIPDAAPQKSVAAVASSDVKHRVERTAETLKKKLAERKKRAAAQGLKEAGDIFSKLEQGIEELRKEKDVDQKKALVKLNNLAAEIRQRREQGSGAKELRKQLNQMKDLKSGPADRMNDALRKGNLKKAISEIQELGDKLRAAKLTEGERKQLAEQLQQMSKKLGDLAAAQQQAKEQLKKQIDQAKAEGDREKAGQLQNKLDKLARKDAQMSKLSQLAQKMGQAAEAAKQGKGGEAAEQMNAVASELSEMEAEIGEMAMMDAALAELESSKDAMNCDSCQGAGCSECSGAGPSQIPGRGNNGQGMGGGRGEGDRPESATANQFYDSKVKGKVGKGKAVVTGRADGPNRRGPALEEYKAAIRSAEIADEDPLTGARIPKEHRQQATEYFNRLREGE